MHSNNSASCSDGTACTVNDGCVSGACQAGAGKGCNDRNLCTNDGCNQATGNCVFDGVPQNGVSCNAHNSVCTVGDKCANGVPSLPTKVRQNCGPGLQ